MLDVTTFPMDPRRHGVKLSFRRAGQHDLNDYPAVKRSLDEMAARPTVQRGSAMLGEQQSDRQISDIEPENVLGNTSVCRPMTGPECAEAEFYRRRRKSIIAALTSAGRSCWVQ
jgi:hypothetical protein